MVKSEVVLLGPDGQALPKKRRKRDGRLTTLSSDPLYDKALPLLDKLTRFFNHAYGRKTVGGVEFLEAIMKALRDGYSPEEIRSVYWIARCLTGRSAWLGSVLRADLLPSVALRHDGGVNPSTGKPAVRWLDEMLARRREASPEMLTTLYNSLPEDMKADEREIARIMGVKVNE